MLIFRTIFSPRSVGELASPLRPGLWFVWAVAFFYSLALGLILQKLVLPLVPSMHAGHGLLFEDAIRFHTAAVKMANDIRAQGWSSWGLMPAGQYTGNVGLLAAIYALFGSEPVFFLPVTAAFHALGVLAIILLGAHFAPAAHGVRNGLLAAFLFLAFPSALSWYGQNHKDAFVIAGYLLSLYAFVRSLTSRSIRQVCGDVLLMSAGLGLVAIMRPHMVSVYVVAFGGAFVALLFWRWLRPGALPNFSCRQALLFLIIGGVVAWGAPVGNKMVTWEGRGSAPSNMSLGGWKWERSAVIPGPVDRLLEKVATIRVHFIDYGQAVGAGSLVDEDIKPKNAQEVFFYLPKAAVVGVFSPFPSFWVERLSLPRVIGSAETLIFYILFPGVLALLVLRPSREVFACLAISLAVITLLGFINPNVGTLHRIRYGQLAVFILAGCIGWGVLLKYWNERFGLSAALSRRLGSEAALPRGSRAFYSGVVVSMVTMLGMLGFFIRDLMLINRSGFGHSLDSYYIAVMLPMFCVSVLAAPMGDALTAYLLKKDSRKDIQEILGAVSSATLVAFMLIGAGLLVTASDVLSLSFVQRDSGEILALLPIALSLFVLSGILVAGNSLLNALGHPVLTALAQCLVPIAVIAAILLADDAVLMRSAMLGMAIGQAINLCVIFLVVKKYGYTLLPGSVAILRLSRELINNYKWLVYCAFLTSFIVPANYWFAGQVGEGAVSVWAVGSKLVQMASLLGAALMTAVFVPYMARVVSSGIVSRVRNDLLVSLIIGSWGSALVVAMVFVFAEPLVFSVMSMPKDEKVAMQLVGVLKFGALQLPSVISMLLLMRFCAISAVSHKAVLASFVGLLINIIFNYLLVSLWGVLGLAMSWAVASVATAVLIMLLTREQSHLRLVELGRIWATWLLLSGGALSLHTQSVTIGLAMLAAAMMVAGWQLRLLHVVR